jgi:hypothetical protein
LGQALKQCRSDGGFFLSSFSPRKPFSFLFLAPFHNQKAL